MLIRTAATSALLLLAACSSGFEPGEDLTTARQGEGVTGSQPDTGPADSQCAGGSARATPRRVCFN